MSINPLYTAHASATGGRDGRARIADPELDLTLAPPKAMGGSGQGHNPEQLFAAGYAACFIGAMKFAASQDDSLPKPPADTRIDAAVGIGPRAEGGFGLAVELTVHLPGLDRAAAERLIEITHGICPYSNATRGNVEVTLTLA